MTHTLTYREEMDVAAALRHLAKDQDRWARAAIADQEYARLSRTAHRLRQLAMRIDPRTRGKASDESA